MSVRAKFYVGSKDPGESGNVILLPVYSTDPNHENKTFWDTTPAGSIQMWINNPEAFAKFKPGEEFFVDFTPAAEQTLDVQNCASCGNDHEAVPANATSTDGGMFECPDSGNPVNYTTNNS